ncbi:lysophospholipid acyltransferase family protein [Sphingomonas xanthus]|uniref:lysophospholipid acyltransferase family protein n=1 Tax=Sphingomonas xanthus TaxID=2594473 RepID=UPI00164D7818|nr:1-acyl-sn-glycerol-3-phosphate acyltransferase [Sphingomonas xanthus]
MTATGTASGHSRLIAIARIAGLVGLFLACLPPHLLSKWLLGRSRWPRRFLRSAAYVAGVRTQVEGQPLAPHTLLAANHSSWLDILILGGSVGAAFVSKVEVKKTLLIGWLADQNRTLYIDRAARGDAHRQVRRIVEALDHPQPLAVFPEGTTGNGSSLLPFRPTLLAAAAPPPPGVSIRPVAIDFHDNASLVSWHSGEPGTANALRILGRPGSIRVTVRLLDPLGPHVDRKALAREAHLTIARALSFVTAPTGL